MQYENEQEAFIDCRLAIAFLCLRVKCEIQRLKSHYFYEQIFLTSFCSFIDVYIKTINP
jgi:hypothetical protein